MNTALPSPAVLDTRPVLRDSARRIVAVGAVVAVVDGLYVVALFSWLLGVTTPRRIFQGIALALVGRSAAFVGGWRTTLLGAGLHLLVAIGWTAVWALAYASSEPLRRAVRTTTGALVVGVAYGVFVHLGMQLLVLPLTNVAARPLLQWDSLLLLLAHMLVIGPPVVLLIGRRATT